MTEAGAWRCAPPDAAAVRGVAWQSGRDAAPLAGDQEARTMVPPPGPSTILSTPRSVFSVLIQCGCRVSLLYRVYHALSRLGCRSEELA
jgi:hypothetical protein